MPQAQLKPVISEEDYLAFEVSSPHKHELVSGQIYAMAGASERHNQIALNIAFHLRFVTRGKSCKTFVADMRLRQMQGTLYYYPDVMLVCDPQDDHPHHKQAPCFIAEVLSPATAATDVREKWLAYQRLPSLRYYLLVDSERVWAQCHVWLPDGQWGTLVIQSDDRLDVHCGDASLSLCLDDLYEDTGLMPC